MRAAAGAFLLTAGVAYLGYGVDRTDSASLILAFTVAFAGYALLVAAPTPAARVYDRRRLGWLIGLGVALRVALLFAFPLLSDDVYRFIWDGTLVTHGLNPFAELPAHYLEAAHAVPGLNAELYAELNSPEYYTIYPPLAQATFTVAVWLFPASWYGAAVVMKVFLLAAELGTLWAFWRLLPAVLGEEGARGRLLLYWLNPLIVTELVGNLHFEAAMVCFLLLGFWALWRSRWTRAGAALALAIASKLLPLLLLPYLLRRLWGRPLLRFTLGCGLVLLLLFTPLLASGFLEGFGSSLDLYFRKFEFNASLYYLARAAGYGWYGWNKIAVIGPALGAAAAVAILLLSLLDGRRGWAALAEGWLFAFVIYLLCTTTVHPWYLSVPVALCVFTPWRFPLLWSYLIALTYTSYATEPYAERLWLVGVEYALVGGYCWWEWRRRKKVRSLHRADLVV